MGRKGLWFDSYDSTTKRQTWIDLSKNPRGFSLPCLVPLSKAPYSPNICSLGATARELPPLMRLLGDTLVACDVARDVDGRSSGNCSGIGGDGTKLESVLEAGATLIEKQQQRWRWREGADFLHGSTDKEERDKKT
ncbi:unnamed protein product [Pleuronectes platessa]|uniref:Uncharacterized protein n=1 Tax=Pleuronectes platessa TaxID=8262 RepID=A0A9N7YBC4_PLEPL|nr:unnamed protein product [Pleuronectes platessa]